MHHSPPLRGRLLFTARFALLAGLLLPATAGRAPAADSSATGVIVGTVANASTRQFLQSAEVRVDGTNLWTVTASDGSFRLSNVPVGPQRVTISYRGLDPETRSVTVGAGTTQRLEVSLSSEVYQLQEFVVAGEREGQAKAVNDQKNADFMKSIVAADAFGDLVDSNAAELLKSLPGFAMNYAGEDAISFSMRGQSSTYASITMDGNGITNSGFGSRAVNMRNVTVNNIEAIEVNRAPNASQPANSMGGSVNLVTRSAFSQQGRRIRLDVGLNLNSEVDDWGRSYQGYDSEHHAQFGTFQLSYSDTFRNESEHPVGLALTLQRGGRYRYNTQYTPSYSYVPGLAAGQLVDESTPAIATGATIQEASAGFTQLFYSGNLEYKLSENTTLYFRGFYQEGPQRHLYGINHRIVPRAGGQTTGSGVNSVAINGNTATTSIRGRTPRRWDRAPRPAAGSRSAPGTK